MFGVSERSVRHWADTGILPCIRTAERHRLFPAAAVTALFERASAGEMPTAGSTTEALVS